MGANVSFQKKTASEYASIAASVAGPVNGRVYFVGDTADTEETGLIYVDGKKYGGGGGGSSLLSDAAAQYYQDQYNTKVDNDFNARFSLTTNSYTNGARLAGSVSSITYKVYPKWKVGNNTTNVSNSELITSLTNSLGNARTWNWDSSDNSFKCVVSTSGVTGVSGETVGMAYYDAETHKTTAKKSVTFSGVSFYNPIIYGSFHGDITEYITAVTFNGNVASFSAGSERGCLLYKKTSAVSSINDFKDTLTIHEAGENYVIMLPKATSISKDVTGQNYASFKTVAALNTRLTFTYVGEMQFNNNEKYAIFTTTSAIGYEAGATLSFSYTTT